MLARIAPAQMNADLHSHSTVSDGTLAPDELVARAAARGVELFALTDHDQLGGLRAAREAAESRGLEFVDGVEVSVSWRGSTIHVVGLEIDPTNLQLNEGLARVRAGRLLRAQKMAAELASVGIEGSLEGALSYAENPAMVSRSHFARHLAAIGAVESSKAAFRQYLVPGKPGYVPHQWAELADALRWIADASGTAVLAHPGRYPLSTDAMDALLAEFRERGGAAIEVVTGSHGPEQYRRFATLASHYGFAASRGSDFHAPDESAELGSLPALEAPLVPVWTGLRRH
jgi:predicted metal-dependent phosphoesterase TrpH